MFIANDALDESDETVKIVLSNPRGAVLVSPQATVVTIRDNDGAGAPALNARDSAARKSPLRGVVNSRE